MDCAQCRSLRREAAVRGRVLYRCFNDGAGERRGRTVDRPWPEGADMYKIGIQAPAWCPRRPERREAESEMA